MAAWAGKLGNKAGIDVKFNATIMLFPSEKPYICHFEWG